MKYIRTKDGRIVEESNLELGFKQTIITIKNKKDNKELRQIVCDNLDDYLEMVVVGEYCKCHKINPKDIKYETVTLFNDIINQADTIEELCDECVCDKKCVGFIDARGFELYKKFDVYGAIWTDKGLIYKSRMKGVLPNGEIDWELL